MRRTWLMLRYLHRLLFITITRQNGPKKKILNDDGNLPQFKRQKLDNKTVSEPLISINDFRPPSLSIQTSIGGRSLKRTPIGRTSFQKTIECVLRNDALTLTFKISFTSRRASQLKYKSWSNLKIYEAKDFDNRWQETFWVELKKEVAYDLRRLTFERTWRQRSLWYKYPNASKGTWSLDHPESEPSDMDFCPSEVEGHKDENNGNGSGSGSESEGFFTAQESDSSPPPDDITNYIPVFHS